MRIWDRKKNKKTHQQVAWSLWVKWNNLVKQLFRAGASVAKYCLSGAFQWLPFHKKVVAASKLSFRSKTRLMRSFRRLWLLFRRILFHTIPAVIMKLKAPILIRNSFRSSSVRPSLINWKKWWTRKSAKMRMLRRVKIRCRTLWSCSVARSKQSRECCKASVLISSASRLQCWGIRDSFASLKRRLRRSRKLRKSLTWVI